MTPAPPQKQLAAFLAKYSPTVAATARASLARMRKFFPTATQLVYNNYNALVIGFGPTERASDAVFSIALYPRWVNLFFLYGAKLPDPHKVLRGNGKRVRSTILESAARLDAAPIRALICEAARRAPVPFPKSGRGPMIIKAISAKQRPRRPA